MDGLPSSNQNQYPQPPPPQPQVLPQSSKNTKLILIIGLVVLIFLGILVYLYYFNKLPYLKQEGYKLLCGQDSPKNKCSYSQLKPKDKVLLEVDISTSFLKYGGQRPDLCYYTNIEPEDNYTTFQKVSIDNKDFYAGCVKNAYSFYRQHAQFTFFINGKLNDASLIVKVFLEPSSQSSIEDKITKEGIQVFELK